MTFRNIIDIYDKEPHRKYHKYKHIINMFNYYKKNNKQISSELFYATIFHDIIYVPGNEDNEEQSLKVFLNYYNYTNKNNINIRKVEDLILATKNHLCDYKDKECQLIVNADMSIFESYKKEELIQYENDIFYEYQKFDLKSYITKRKEFLYKVKEFYNRKNMFHAYDEKISRCDFLIDYINSRTYKIGIYAGSFNPFHIGHEDVCQQAERVFDKVIIAQGYNREKQKPIKKIHSIREIIQYPGLITDLFNKEPHCEKYLVRGLRNSFDVAYEDNLRNTILDFNPNIQVIYFFCQKRNEHINSSMIRSLYEFGEETYKKYLP